MISSFIPLPADLPYEKCAELCKKHHWHSADRVCIWRKSDIPLDSKLGQVLAAQSLLVPA